MHIIDVLLYIVAVASFAIGVVETVRTTPTKLGPTFFLLLGLLAWVLVPALKLWGVGG
jgi:hypothetical protein